MAGLGGPRQAAGWGTAARLTRVITSDNCVLCSLCVLMQNGRGRGPQNLLGERHRLDRNCTLHCRLGRPGGHVVAARQQDRNADRGH